jgi:hypothetical protein
LSDRPIRARYSYYLAEQLTFDLEQPERNNL